MGSIVGVDLTRIDTEKKYELGQLYVDKLGNTYRYMQADGTVLPNELMSFIAGTWQIDAQLDSTVTPADTESVPACVWNGSSTSIGDNEYAFVFVGPGLFTSKVAGNVAADAIVYVTTTAGQIDDSATACLLPGVRAPAAITASAGETGQFYVSHELYATDLA